MLKFLLQLFGEGGDGGDGSTSAPEGTAAESSGEEIPAFIPEKARDTYKKAMEIQKAKQQVSVPETEPEKSEPSAPSHVAYTDLIKSDEYKEEHKAYMDKTIGDRLKKYKGMEEKSNQMQEVLSVVAQKYNLDPNAEDYLDKLTEAVNADDAYVENYAIEHDLSNEEARKQIDMRRRLDNFERDKALREEQAQRDYRTQRLIQAAEEVKAVYPQFDLETEMKNEKFVNLCRATGEDVMAAYEVCHREELKALQTQAIAQKAQQQIAASVASNASRPIENGLSSQAPTIVSQDFSNMSLQQIREFAAQQRQKAR